MKKIVVLIVVSSTFLLCGCSKKNTESDRNSEETKSTLSQEKKTVLQSLNLPNQSEVNTWEEGDPVLPEKGTLEELQRVVKLNRNKAGNLPLTPEIGSFFGGATLAEQTLLNDYIFTGTIEELDFDYSNIVYDDNKNIIEAEPVTNFNIKILHTAKGELPVGSSIRIRRSSFGIDVNQQEFMDLTGEKNIPEMGKSYVFLCYVVDGELYLNYLNGDILLDNSPMNLSEQSNEVIEEVLKTSATIREINDLVSDKKATLAKIKELNPDYDVTDQEESFKDDGDKIDLNKVIIKE